MDDLISRQAAIDALAKFVPYVIDDISTESYTNGLTDAYNLICQLPSAQPYSEADIQKMQDLEQAEIQKAYELGKLDAEPQWIPCSERLPESDDDVLVCAKDYFECELYENLTARVCEVFPGETSTQELDFGCKHGECGNCDMESRKPYSIRMHVGWIEADNKWDGELSDSEIVIAWMPLPEPYREEGEE